MTLVKTKNGKGLIPSVFSDFFDTDNFLSPRMFNWGLEESLPAANIKETDKEFDIELAAPGFEKKDFKINVENDILSISAEKETEKKEETETFRRREFSYNSFARSFTLPKSVFGDKINATYENGLLKLVVPKKEETKVTNKKEITVA